VSSDSCSFVLTKMILACSLRKTNDRLDRFSFTAQDG
jgi:hypothetical protein